MTRSLIFRAAARRSSESSVDFMHLAVCMSHNRYGSFRRGEGRGAPTAAGVKDEKLGWAGALFADHFSIHRLSPPQRVPY